MEKKVRGMKTTKEQYKYYVEFLQSNNALRTNKNTPENPNQVEEAYEELTRGLNAIGGPQRTPNAWKKIMADWKSVTKKKAREIAAFKLRTGGGPPCKKTLDELENKLLDTIGRVVVDGAPNVIEAGLPNSASTSLILDNIEIIMDNSIMEEPTTVVNLENQEPALKKRRTDDTTAENTSTGQATRKHQTKIHKTPVEKVTDAYAQSQLQNRAMMSGIVDELSGIKKSLTQLAEAQEKLAKIKLLKLKLKYPNAQLDDI